VLRRSIFLRLLLLLLLLLLTIAGCGASAPSPAAGDMSELLGALALRGATIHQQVSGDAGCADSTLHPNALRIDLTLAQDGTDYEVYLFRWRRPVDFDASADRFRACFGDYAGSIVGDVDVDSLEVRPWRAFGPAWTDELRRTLDDALRATGGG